MEVHPVTHATGMGPLPDLLAQRAGTNSVKAVFSEVGLPLALIDDRRQRLPMPMLARLYEKAAERAGDALLGLTVGSTMAPGDYGLWARYAIEAPTLGEGINRAIRTLHLHESGTTMRLAEREGGLTAWEYWHPDIANPKFRQHSDHLIPIMMRFVQAFLGPDWTPFRVEHAYATSQQVEDHEAVTQCAWICGQPKVALVMRSREMKSGRPQHD